MQFPKEIFLSTQNIKANIFFWKLWFKLAFFGKSLMQEEI